MEGEIRGRRAGETCTELTLPRFLLFRCACAESWGVLRRKAEGVPGCGVPRFAMLLGDVMAFSWGLWVVEAGALGRAKAGDGRGWKARGLDDGALFIFGVSSPVDCVSIRARFGRVGFTASGRLNPPISSSSASVSWAVVAGDF